MDEVLVCRFPYLTETRLRNALAAFLFKGDEVYKNLKSVRAASVQELLC